MPTTAPTPHKMTRIGRYELGPLLGKGGAGLVHAATLRGHGGFEMPVALKVLKDGESAELWREARMGGLLRHENLVDVYEVGEADGTWFCAMERCAGSLAKHRPLPPRAVVEVGLAVCDALHYAHQELGLVHLDLKPANLLFTADGVVKVADLGIARARGFEDDGRRRGTVGYMSPEHLRGDPVDARSDVFALALTLQELASSPGSAHSETVDYLSDDPPAAAPTSDHLSSDTMPLDELVTDEAPRDPAGWLEPLLHRALAPAPADRPDMRQLADLLRRVDVEGPSLREHLGLADQDREHDDGATEGPSPDTFVGRTTELDRLDTLLEAPGLLTLKGPAGVGKSRLALEAVARWRAGGGQAWVAELVEARSGLELVGAVARALGIRLGGGNPARQVGHALGTRQPSLLVLDNFEQLVDHAEVVAQWAEQSPQTRFLITSRTPLGLADEQVLELSLLDEPTSMTLLAARARERGADVADHPRLPELARRLDGLPLALELAAGRLGVLSVDDVLEHLDLAFLRRGSPDRHGTLSAALDWGWTLLDADQRRALAQLTVFAGGFELAGAEAVLDGSAVVLLDGLLERSWLHARGSRLVLLESVRAFARAHGDGVHEAEIRHGRHMATVGDRAGPAGSAGRLGALVRERDNLVAACRRAVRRGDGQVAVDTLTRARHAIGMQGPPQTLLELATEVDSMELPPHLEARTHREVGIALRDTGDFEGATQRLEAAIAALDAVDDAVGATWALINRAGLHRRLGALEACEPLLLQARSRALALGNDALHSHVLGNLGGLYADQGRSDEAVASLRHAMSLHRRLGDRVAEANSWGQLGMALRDQGELAEVEEHYQRALALHRELGNRRGEGQVYGTLALVYGDLGELDKAEQCFHDALKAQREVGNLYTVAITLGNLGTQYRRQHRIQEARQAYAESLALHDKEGSPRYAAYALAQVADIDRTEGDLDRARTGLEEAVEKAAEVGFVQLSVWATCRLARLEASDGNGDAAEALLEQAQGHLRGIEVPILQAEVHLSRALVRHALGEPGADDLLDQAEGIGRQIGNTGLLEAIAGARATVGGSP